jgi:threonine/homoserine/homoserine lactone efflux protein
MAAMGFTPCLNNILVASSGVNFGFRASVCTWTLFGHSEFKVHAFSARGSSRRTISNHLTASRVPDVAY